MIKYTRNAPALPGPVQVAKFDSIQEFAREVQRLPARRKGVEQAALACMDGDMGLARKADAFIHAYEPDLHTNRWEWEHSVEGAYPMVPEFLQGAPECMRQRKHHASELGPVRIFACVTVSGGMSEALLQRRGAAVMALAQVLSTMRPVELYAYTDLHCPTPVGANGLQLSLIRLETAPMDLATVGVALVSTGVARALTFTWADQYRFNGGWGWNSTPMAHETAMRLALDANPEDIVVSGGYLHDELLARDPAGWVRHMVKLATDVDA